MSKRVLVAIVTAVCSANGLAAESTEVSEVSDLLHGRWFEAEIVIFERLSVLDTNSPERLALHRPRSWPAIMTALDPPQSLYTADIDQAIPQEPRLEEPEIMARIQRALTLDDPQCFGFFRNVGDAVVPVNPFVEPRDEIHPTLVAVLNPEPLELATLPPEEPLAAFTDIEPETTQPGPATRLAPTPLLQLLADVAAFEDGLRQTSLIWLGADEFKLTDAVKSINRQNELRPIFHGRWRQDVPPREQPTVLYFAGTIDAEAPATHAGLAKVEGTLSLSVARYLHFAPTLWYHADTLGLDPVPLPLSGDGYFDPDRLLYMELNESRRMRSDEMHYLDHPKIGVLVRIDAVAVPDSLQAAWRAISEPPSESGERDE